MGSDRHRKKADRRRSHQAEAEVVDVANSVLDIHLQAEQYRKAWKAEQELSKGYKTDRDRWKSRAGILAFMFWAVFGSWIAFVVLQLGGK